MTTTTGPDLTVAQAAVEALMDDTCEIVRGRKDAGRVLDPGTGELSAPAVATVYGAGVGRGDGRCKVKPEFQPGETPEGGAPTIVARYKVDIPLPGPGDLDPQEGDIVIMTGTRRDPALDNRALRVAAVEYKTFAVQRTLHCEMRTVPADRP